MSNQDPDLVVIDGFVENYVEVISEFGRLMALVTNRRNQLNVDLDALAKKYGMGAVMHQFRDRLKLYVETHTVPPDAVQLMMLTLKSMEESLKTGFFDIPPPGHEHH